MLLLFNEAQSCAKVDTGMSTERSESIERQYVNASVLLYGSKPTYT